MTRNLKNVQIARHLVHQLLLYAGQFAEEEICGLMAGRFERRQSRVALMRIVPIKNVADAPQTQFMLDPHEQIQALTQISRQNLDLVGIFHSHPHGPARPSDSDLQAAAYPDVVYCIIFPRRLAKCDAENVAISPTFDLALGVWQISTTTYRPVAIDLMP